MLKSCPCCGRIHDSRVICAPKKRRRDAARTEAERFRSTHRWTQKSLEIRARDKGLCRLCLQKGIVEWRGLQVHHIVPLAEDPGQGLSGGNLITLCKDCHERAERDGALRERLRRLAGEPAVLPDGQPPRG